MLRLQPETAHVVVAVPNLFVNPEEEEDEEEDEKLPVSFSGLPVTFSSGN